MSARGGYKARPAGSLKAAQARLVQLSGGQKEAAFLAGRGKSSVFRWTNADGENADESMPLHIMARLERLAGEPVVTRWLAANMGCALLELETHGSARLDGDLAAIGAEVAGLFREYQEAIAPDDDTPGRIDPAEAGRMIAALDTAMAAMAAMRGHLDSVIAEEADHG